MSALFHLSVSRCDETQQLNSFRVFSVWLQHLNIFKYFCALSSFNCLSPGQDNYLVISLPIQTSLHAASCVFPCLRCVQECQGTCKGVCEVMVGVQGAERSLLWRKCFPLAEGACLMSPRECELTDLHLQTCEWVCVCMFVHCYWKRCSKAVLASNTFPVSYATKKTYDGNVRSTCRLSSFLTRRIYSTMLFGQRWM